MNDELLDRIEEQVNQAAGLAPFASDALADAASEIRRLRLTGAEREAIGVAMHRCDTPHYKTLRSLLERTDA